MINTIDIPKVNLQNEILNEDIYNIYKVFVYSSPVEIANKTNVQRFKEVLDKGKWVKEDTGKRGEYYILGTDYNGNFVTNVYFPVDFVPETTPDNWNFLYNEEANKSWRDNSKYKYEEQLDYMKNSNIFFDKIDIENNICDSYDLVEYDINAQKIGLDKAVLETCSTWTTSGVINVKRLTLDNQIRYATFFVKPMAASAQIQSFFNIEGTKNDMITLNDSNIIRIDFGASAVNLTDYANEKHIKKIHSEVYVNGKKIKTITSSKIKSIIDNIEYEIPDDVLSQKEKNLNVKIKSYLYTEFSVDGILYDEIERNITIQYNVSENIVPLSSVKVKMLEKKGNSYFVKDFIKTKITDESDSIGLIEKGKYVVLKINNVNVESVDKIQLKVNNVPQSYNVLSKDSTIIIQLRIKEDKLLKNLNSIITWKSLRDSSKNYFKMDFSNVGKRIKEPNLLEVDVDTQKHTFKFDVIDEYIYNMNYKYLSEILNENRNNEELSLEEWKLKEV